MDTDALSTEAYKGIITEAEKFNPDLALQFGLIADSCENEAEYLLKAKKLIKEIRELDEYDLSDLFFGSVPGKKLLLSTLEKILTNISTVERIPANKKHYEF